MSRKFKNGLLMAFLAAVIMFNSCEEDSVRREVFYSFSGIVTDFVSGLPVDSAKVSLHDSVSGLFWYTDSTGYFIGSEFVGKHSVFVQKAGFISEDTVIDLFENLTNVDFLLVPDTSR